MCSHAFRKACFALFFVCISGWAQTAGLKETSGPDVSKEGAVIEKMTSTVIFQTDGTSTRKQHARVRVQSDAGVRQFGLLRLPYQASVERVEVSDVHVTQTNGSVVVTPLDQIQDVTSDVYRDAPMYSDLREKHLAVKGLEPGDTLEYSVVWRADKPLAPGQFWFGYSFMKSSVVLDEQLEINIPRERDVRLKSQSIQPTTRDENGRRIYIWKSSNLESQSVEKQKEVQGYDAIRGLLPPSDVLISSFRSWEEVGRWYESLQQERVQPSPEVVAKAAELTKGLSDEAARLRAVYNYVSLRYRYVAISFGIGRYQPHASGEILGNQFGDCKDKHTLLAALLSATGIRAYPALINSSMKIDADVPSPGQFDHVISVVPQGTALFWMDTTPEVTPIEYLAYRLRGKPALVIKPDKAAFESTPVNPPVANSDDSKLTAKLGDDGTLQASSETLFRGDNELYFRYAFRRVPEAQWKDFGQHVFNGARLGGTITNVRVSPPEKTDEPFDMAYDYTLKDFSAGGKHRFVIPLPSLGLPEVKDEDLKRTTPLWLGYVGEARYESRIELPKGWSTAQLVPMDLKESFAEFQESSEERDGVLTTKRTLLLKASAVSPDQLTTYKKFQKSISDRCSTYTYFSVSTATPSVGTASTPAQGIARAAELLRQRVLQLPDSANQEALQAEQTARRAIQTSDYTSAAASLKHAVSLDPTFSRAWIELGSTSYAGTREMNVALNAFQKAVEADPKQTLPYKVLAFVYMGLGKRDDAIATWQKLQALAPDDSDLTPNLGGLYTAQKRYSEAAALFESAVKANPSDARLHASLGIVRLRSHDTDQALEAFHKALEIDSGAEMLNNVAYEMAEANTSLPDALTYSQRSIKDAEEQSQKVDLSSIQSADRLLPLAICAYWDTLGWIYFKMGDMTRAESYLEPAWRLSQDGSVGDHLGQVYEKERKLPEALHMYNLALQANPRLEETPSRMRGLAHVHLPENRMTAGEEMSRMRTTSLSTITKEPASADFDVVLVAGKIEKANFVKGSALLRDAAGTLEKTRFEGRFPPNSTAHVLRKGILSCSSYVGCSFVFYPLSASEVPGTPVPDHPAAEKANPALSH